MNQLTFNKFFVFLLFLTAVSIFSPSNAATTIFDNGFESSNLSGYSLNVVGGTAGVANSPIKTGKYSGKFNLPFSLGNYRSEILPSNNKSYFAFEKEYWLGLNYRYEDWADDTSAEIAPFQIHTRPSQWTTSCQYNNAVGYAPFLMLSQNGEARFYTYGGKILWKGSVQKKQWLNITVHFKISTGSGGYIEVWKDGSKIGQVNGPNSPKYDNCGGLMRTPFFKMGIYKWDWKYKKTNSSNRQLFIDDLKIVEGSSSYSMVTSTSSQAPITSDISFASTGLSSTQQDEDDALIAHWPMNVGIGPTLQDASGNGYTATLVNGAQLMANDGVKFDGVNDYVNAGKPKISGKDLTISGWIWADGFNHCKKLACTIVSKATGPTIQDHDILLGTVKKGSKIRLRFRVNTDGATSTLTAKTGAVEAKSWIHVAAVFTGKRMRLYQNGVLVGSKVHKGSVTLGNKNPITIGGNSYDAAFNPWFGKISDVRFYNYALTKKEIAELAK